MLNYTKQLYSNLHTICHLRHFNASAQHDEYHLLIEPSNPQLSAPEQFANLFETYQTLRLRSLLPPNAVSV